MLLMPQALNVNREVNEYDDAPVSHPKSNDLVCAFTASIICSMTQAQKKVRALARGASHGLSSRVMAGNNHREGVACASLVATRPHLTSDSTGRLASAAAKDQDYKAPVNRGVRCYRVERRKSWPRNSI